MPFRHRARNGAGSKWQPAPQILESVTAKHAKHAKGTKEITPHTTDRELSVFEVVGLGQAVFFRMVRAIRVQPSGPRRRSLGQEGFDEVDDGRNPATVPTAASPQACGCAGNRVGAGLNSDGSRVRQTAARASLQPVTNSSTPARGNGIDWRSCRCHSTGACAPIKGWR